MRKLILQIRYTIFSRLLCVRHLQTILPYSPYLYGIFAFYSNFSPLPEFTFAKRKVFWLNWNLLFQFTKNFAGTSLLLHIYCISSEASIPTIQDRINTIIPDLFVAYAIAKEHNAITTTEVIILFFSFMPPLSLACNMTLPLFIVKHFEIRRCSLRYRILYSWIYCKRSHTFRTSKENLKLLLFFTNTI